jgi:hypothetical protein
MATQQSIRKALTVQDRIAAITTTAESGLERGRNEASAHPSPAAGMAHKAGTLDAVLAHTIRELDYLLEDLIRGWVA